MNRQYQYPSFSPPYNAYPPSYSYELGQKKNGKFREPLISQSSSQVVLANSQRSCTDTICAIVMLLFFGAFIGLLIYGCVKGSGYAVISIYNYDGLRCNQQPGFYYGYLPHLSDPNADLITKFADAVCVNTCPTSTTTTTCLKDGGVCSTGSFTAQYSSFPIAFYCIPDFQFGQVNIQSIFSFNLDSIGTWIYDLQVGWIVLVAAAGAAIVLSIIFFLFVRCCAGPIIWLAILIFIGGMITIGVFFILQAKGVTVPDFIAASLSSISYNTLIIVGSCLLGGAVLVLLLVICLRSRISMGAKAVELGSIFLFQNCCLVILPVTQAILVFGTFVAMVAGSSFIYSLGDLSLPNNSAFAIFSLPVSQIIMLCVYIAACLWTIFFFNGCNSFMLSSSVAVWYFNDGSPCCDSLHRLTRFHSGSVALTCLINSLFFIIKILASIFSFDVKQDDNRLVSCCLKFLNAIFCVFKLFMRFLSQGTYVQIAIAGKGYCTSTFKAFDIIANNAIKVSLTDGLSIFFTILGVLGITLGIAVAAYFAILYIPFYQQRINNAFIVTLVSALIAFVISAIYLSMIDGSASSVLQCYFVDHQVSGGKIRYGNQSVKQVLKSQ